MAEVSINTGINIFKNNIAEVIGRSQLPVGVLYYTLKDILSEIENIYQGVLQKESEDLAKQLDDNDKKERKENKEY